MGWAGPAKLAGLTEPAQSVGAWLEGLAQPAGAAARALAARVAPQAQVARLALGEVQLTHLLGAARSAQW